jgi:FKBP-type peptidyl-prolyl cis-trans isomerase FklB
MYCTVYQTQRPKELGADVLWMICDVQTGWYSSPVFDGKMKYTGNVRDGKSQDALRHLYSYGRKEMARHQSGDMVSVLLERQCVGDQADGLSDSLPGKSENSWSSKGEWERVFIAIFFMVLILVNVFCTPAAADETKDKTGYSVGYQIGEDLRKQNMNFDGEAFLKGIRDAKADNEPMYSPEAMRSALVELKKKVTAQNKSQKADKRIELANIKEKYRGEGRDFLTENGKKEGVVTLPSGLQYKVIKEGTGKKPGPSDTVLVNYRGTLIDGTEFDSSYKTKKPAKLHVNGVIQGWKEALQLMKEGAKWQLFVPADLAYGERGPLADRTVIFDIELIKVE